MSGFTEDDARLCEIVGGELDLDFVTRDDANKVLSHLPGDVREDVATVREVHAKHGTGEDGGHDSFDFYGIFSRHGG